MASGIKDKVAILGMGCSKFGERWDTSADDLMVEAYIEALDDAGIEPNQLDAAWFSHHIDYHILRVIIGFMLLTAIKILTRATNVLPEPTSP